MEALGAVDKIAGAPESPDVQPDLTKYMQRVADWARAVNYTP